MPGERFGRYRLLRKIASGGMADVYLAEDPDGRRVAIKRIRASLSGDPEFVSMLEQEGRISMLLGHPNIIQTREVGREGDQYFIAMEYVDGIDLYRLMLELDRSGTEIPHEVTAYVGLQVCSALAYLHGLTEPGGRPMRLIHRDVSPMNVLLSWNGEVKICDFGIAKARDMASRTKSGVIKGKFNYLSPEYASGQPIDHRSDMFSLGICLWEMICGRMLFLEDDGHSVLEAVREARVPPPSAFREDVPPELERIVLKALQRAPEARFESCGHMAGALQELSQALAPGFARDHLAQFLHNGLHSFESRAHGDAPPGRRPDQATARIDLQGGQERPAGSTDSLATGTHRTGETTMSDQPNGGDQKASNLSGSTIAMDAKEVERLMKGAPKPPAGSEPSPTPPQTRAATPKKRPARPKAAAPKAAAPKARQAPGGGDAYAQKTAFFDANDPQIAAALEKAKAAAKAPKRATAAKRAATPRAAAARPVAKRAATPGPAAKRTAAGRPAAKRPAAKGGASKRAATPRAGKPAEGEAAYSQKTAFIDLSNPDVAAAIEQAKQAAPAARQEPQAKRPAKVQPRKVVKAQAKKVVRPQRKVAPEPDGAQGPPTRAMAPIKKQPAAAGAQGKPVAQAAKAPKVVKKAGIKVVKKAEGRNEAEPKADAEARKAAARERVAKARERKAKLKAAEEPEEKRTKTPVAPEDEPAAEKKGRTKRERASKEAAAGGQPEKKAAAGEKAEKKGEKRGEKRERKAKKGEKKAEPKRSDTAVRVARGGEPKKVMSLPVILIALGVLVFGGFTTWGFIKSCFGTEYGKIRVTSEPPGASITFDGKPLGKKTPFTIKKVPADQDHEIVLSLEGYEEKTESDVTVAPDDTEQVHIKLDPLPGSLKITSTPSGAEVVIDDKPRGKTPLTVKKLDRSRSYPIVIHKKGYEEYRAIWIWEGKKQHETLEVTLTKARRRRRRR